MTIDDHDRSLQSSSWADPWQNKRRNHGTTKANSHTSEMAVLNCSQFGGKCAQELKTQLLSTNERATVLPRFQGKMVNKCHCVFLSADHVDLCNNICAFMCFLMLDVGVSICVGSYTAHDPCKHCWHHSTALHFHRKALIRCLWR